MKYVIFASYGNDSIALIQFARDRGLKDVAVVYSDTGWAFDSWRTRVARAEMWVRSLGFKPYRTESEGLLALAARKKAWPRGGGGRFQFCTQHLKILPALAWLDEHDPEKDATCMNGVRRCESKNRADAPEWVESSEAHGGRELWSPLVRHDDEDRDALIRKTPFDVLPFKSKECWPCVNANQKELKILDENRIAVIEVAEQQLGVNSRGNPRVMFSPKRHGGAVGIRAVVDHAKRGKKELIPQVICSSGWCG